MSPLALEVKVCGLRDPGMALDCVESGAAAIGLVFFAASPRAVAAPDARAVVGALPEGVTPVGVFVDCPVDNLLRICDRSRLRCVQLHGDEPPDTVERLVNEGLRVVKALRESGKALCSAARSFAAADAFLIECGRGPLPGGNAESWDWSGARVLSSAVPFALAGGLAPANVGAALSAACPDAVDVSSGVESSPGVKDPALVRAFIAEVRKYRPAAVPRNVFIPA